MAKDTHAEILSELFGFLKKIMDDRKIDHLISDEIANESVDMIREHWGGSNIYFPKDLHIVLQKRNKKIINEFNGENQGELARAYKLSVQQVYKIIKNEQSAHKNRALTS